MHSAGVVVLALVLCFGQQICIQLVVVPALQPVSCISGSSVSSFRSKDPRIGAPSLGWSLHCCVNVLLHEILSRSTRAGRGGGKVGEKYSGVTLQDKVGPGFTLTSNSFLGSVTLLPGQLRFDALGNRALLYAKTDFCLYSSSHMFI